VQKTTSLHTDHDAIASPLESRAICGTRPASEAIGFADCQAPPLGR
jgi:hypothetical protein